MPVLWCVWSDRLECPDCVVWAARVCVRDRSLTWSHQTANCRAVNWKEASIVCRDKTWHHSASVRGENLRSDTGFWRSDETRFSCNYFLIIRKVNTSHKRNVLDKLCQDEDTRWFKWLYYDFFTNMKNMLVNLWTGIKNTQYQILSDWIQDSWK